MKTLILVGAGHAHLVALEGLSLLMKQGVRIILISEVERAPYSGMLPGFLAGFFTEQEMSFELRGIADHYGIELHVGEVVEIRNAVNEILLASGETMIYDCLSLNTGILPIPISCSEEDLERVIYVKPLSHLVVKWKKFLAQKNHLTIAVVGGGSAGVEVATALSLQNKGTVTLFSHSSEILPQLPKPTRLKATKRLLENNISFKTNATVTAFNEGKLLLQDAEHFACDYVFVCTGALPNKIRSSLTCDQKGFLLTDKNLRVAGSTNVFAAGDCINFNRESLPKAGVYSVRQGKYLGLNILAFLNQKELSHYVPQKDFLKIITTGNRRALMVRGSFSYEGRLAWLLKTRIDLKFMKRYQKKTTSR